MKKNLTKPNDMFVSGTPMGDVRTKLSSQKNYANVGYNEFACVQSKQKTSDDSKTKSDTKLFFF